MRERPGGHAPARAMDSTRGTTRYGDWTLTCDEKLTDEPR